MKLIMKNLVLGFVFASFFVSAQADNHMAKVDLGKSEFKWTGSKKVGDKHFGTIKLKSADAKIKNGKIQSGTFVMDMTSIDVTDLKGEWKKKFLNHMRSADFFEVSEHKTATLTIDKQTSKNEVSGKLTVRGKTKPVKIKFNNKGKVYSGTFVFNRTDFGVEYGSENSRNVIEKGVAIAKDKVINDSIELDFKVVLK